MSAMLFEQLALDLDAATPDDVPTLTECARSYWSARDVVRLLLRLDDDVIRDAKAAMRGCLNGRDLAWPDYVSGHRAVTFAPQSARPVAVPWRELAAHVRTLRDRVPNDVVTRLILAVTTHTASMRRISDATSGAHWDPDRRELADREQIDAAWAAHRPIRAEQAAALAAFWERAS